MLRTSQTVLSVGSSESAASYSELETPGRSPTQSILIEKRQDPIKELFETEASFRNDLKLINEVYIPKIKEACLWEKRDPIDIINNLFFNYDKILDISQNFITQFTARKHEDLNLSRIGDIFLNFTTGLEEFGYYASHAQFSMKYWLSERMRRTLVAKYILKCETDKRVNKKNIDTFLARPTYRLGQYPLFLRQILKFTPINSQESSDLLESLYRIEACLSLLDNITDKEERQLQLKGLQDRMFYKNGSISQFGLGEANREIIHEGDLKKAPFGERITMFLFDHALFITKPHTIKTTSMKEYELLQKPLKLEEIHLEETSGLFALTQSKSTLENSFTIVAVSNKKLEKIILLTTCLSEKVLWFDKINNQRQKVMAMKAQAFFTQR